jgi:ethanolamine utilization protein EutA
VSFLPDPPIYAIPAAFATARLHEDIEPHLHLTEAEQKALADRIWRLDNVEFTTVGIDIGSSTSHLVFSRVHLRRRTHNLSSRFIVVERRILWTSPILFTPFLSDDTIDAAALGRFIESAYQAAGLGHGDVDTGAVILTGEAMKRRNAAAIAALFADEAGKFVCASAGHRLEAALAAHGSGAAQLSETTGKIVLNVDIGGGTTKLALCAGGRILSVSAFAVGGRLVARDETGCIVRLDEPARQVAQACGLSLALGGVPAPDALPALVRRMADRVLATIRREAPDALGQALQLTEPLEGPQAELVSFSGGVAEFVYGREARDFGDIARPLASAVMAGLSTTGLTLADAGQGIRATAIGVSQFTVQVSGKTIYRGDVALPVYNLPVAAPALAPEDLAEPERVAQAIAEARGRLDLDFRAPLALALRFSGSPTYSRLRGLAQGIAAAFADSGQAPLVLMLDGDVGRSLGRLLRHEFPFPRQLLCIDGLELKDFDFVDIGPPVEVTGVLPVVVKSLLFGR